LHVINSKFSETYHDLIEKGIPSDIMSGGSTGTYNIDPAFDG